MAKTARRKPARKRHPKQPGAKIDRELEMLAEVLDEYRLDNNADGWFSVPWHNGWNATHLMFRLWHACVDETETLDAPAAEFIAWALTNRPTDVETYSRATQLIADGVADRMLMAALRCLQLQISNSSGGGTVFNDIIKNAIRDTTPDQMHADLVLVSRCHDALGTTPTPQNDGFDHRRGAFMIAWRRGLYHAAYSIQPISER